MALDIVIMAAGKGTRMKSDPARRCCTGSPGASLLQHVLHAAAQLGADAHRRRHRPWRRRGGGSGRRRRTCASFASCPSSARATRCSRRCPSCTPNGTTLILNGDVPLIEADTARALLAAADGTKLALLTVELADASGYGRVLRSAGSRGARASSKHKDATPAAARDPRGLHRHHGGADRAAEALAVPRCATTTCRASTT